MNALKIVGALLFATTLAACGGTGGTGPVVNPPSNPGPIDPGPIDPSQPTPYTMQGVVKNAQGQPLAGVEVWADNTLYYNMNALGTTDAQGRYSISLPRNEMGTWRAGGRFKREYHGEWYDISLAVDDEGAFATDAGAIRHFTLKISGKRPGGGFYGGMVWAYGSYQGEGFDLDRVEVTLTPDGPLLDGSAGQPLTRFLDGSVIEDVPLGRYKVTARYVPEGGAAQPMLVMNRDEDAYATSTTVMFRNSAKYGIMADFNVKLAPQP